jgi:hypothetical protein
VGFVFVLIFVGIMVLVACAVAAIVWLVVKLVHGQRERRAKIWAEVAAGHGLGFNGNEIVGSKYGQAIRAYTETRGSGENQSTHTVVAARLHPPLDLGLSIRRHGFFNDLFNAAPDIVVGDAPFDAIFMVSGDEPERVAQLLQAPLRRLLVEQLSQGVTFNLGDQGIAVETGGATSDGAWLHHAIEICARAAAKLDRARQEVRMAAPLAAHRRAWSTFAEAHGLHGRDTPMCLWGRLGGSEVYAYAVRVGRLSYQLEVSLRFSEALGLGLDVQPLGVMDRVAIFFGGQDHRFDDPSFDECFRVKVSDVDGVGQVLNGDVRRRLVELQRQVGPTLLSDQGLAVRLSCIPHDPTVVPRIINQLSDLTETIGTRARDGRRQAYR